MKITVERLATLIGMAMLSREEAAAELEEARAEIQQLKTRLPKDKEVKNAKSNN